jgi:hypothetical protein
MLVFLLNSARHPFFQLYLVLFSACIRPYDSPLIHIVSQVQNDIGADGARAVADAMRVNSSVQKLNLVCLVLLNSARRILFICVCVFFSARIPLSFTSDPHRFTEEQ